MLLAKYIHINMDKNKRPKLYTLPDTLQAVQCPPLIRSARRGLSGIQCRPVQRASVRACVSVRGVVCLASGTACATACDAQAVRVCWVWVSTSGVYGESRGWGGQRLE